MTESPGKRPFDLIDPRGENAYRPMAWLSLCGILLVPLLLGITFPLLHAHVAWGFETDHPQIEDLGALALATEVVFASTLSALVGLLLSSFSRRRQERWRFLRIASWTINGLAAMVGITWIALLLVGDAMVGFIGPR